MERIPRPTLGVFSEVVRGELVSLAEELAVLDLKRNPNCQFFPSTDAPRRINEKKTIQTNKHTSESTLGADSAVLALATGIVEAVSFSVERASFCQFSEALISRRDSPGFLFGREVGGRIDLKKIEPLKEA